MTDFTYAQIDALQKSAANAVLRRVEEQALVLSDDGIISCRLCSGLWRADDQHRHHDNCVLAKSSITEV